MARILSEQETTLTFNEDEAHVLVWSASPRFHREMEKLSIEPYKVDPRRRSGNESEESRWYRIPKCLRIRPRRKVLDAEQVRLRAQGFQPPRVQNAQPRLQRHKIVRPVGTSSTSPSDPGQPQHDMRVFRPRCREPTALKGMGVSKIARPSFHI